MDIVNLPRSSVISAGGMIFQNWSKAAAQKIEILKQFHPKDLAGRFVDFPAGNFDIFNLQADQSDAGMDRASLSPTPDHPLSFDKYVLKFEKKYILQLPQIYLAIWTNTNIKAYQSDAGMDRASLSPNPDHPLLLTNIFCYLKKII